MPIATAHRPAIARTPKSPTFLPYSTVPVTQPPAVSLNLGNYNHRYFRLRKGKYRAIFYAEGGDLYVVHVGKREEVYRLWE